MAKIHGKNGAIKVAAANLVGHLQSWNLDEKVEVLRGYSMGDAWQDAEAGVKSWAGSCEAYFDPADAGQIALAPGDEVQLDFYPAGEVSGATYRSGTAVISGTPLTANKDGWVSVTINFEGKGALTTGTVV